MGSEQGELSVLPPAVADSGEGNPISSTKPAIANGNDPLQRKKKKVKAPKPGSKAYIAMKKSERETSAKPGVSAEANGGGGPPNVLYDDRTVFFEFMDTNSMKGYLERPHVFYERVVLSGPLEGVNMPVTTLFSWYIIHLRRTLTSLARSSSLYPATAHYNTIEQRESTPSLTDSLARLTIATTPGSIRSAATSTTTTNGDGSSSSTAASDSIGNYDSFDKCVDQGGTNNDELAQKFDHLRCPTLTPTASNEVSSSLGRIFTAQELWIVDRCIAAFSEAYPNMVKPRGDVVSGQDTPERVDLVRVLYGQVGASVLDKVSDMDSTLRRVFAIETILSLVLGLHVADTMTFDTSANDVVDVDDKNLFTFDWDGAIWDYENHRRERCLYLIGYLKPDKSTILHEWCHSVYYLNDKYRSQVQTMYKENIPDKIKIVIEKELQLRGYIRDNFVDEWQAYIVESPAEFGKKNASFFGGIHTLFKRLVGTPSPQDTIKLKPTIHD